MTEKFKVEGLDWNKRHLEAYLRTDGEVGHLVDFSPVGGPDAVPCLILDVIGRKTGAPHRLPLIYGNDDKRFIIVASKGGAPEHPAWFLNLEAKPSVKFQIVDKKYRGRAEVAESPERERLFEMMARIYPPFVDYQQRTAREIPVVVLEAEAEIDRL